ncbi:MAG: hypothetical protein HYV92_11545 [Candidatus Rokubacteria bacterium]|nr:hypothetical protein [Candidatus Rokubacteria bacterium]MBI2555017.1 hypothetical protein [Candidatus Rokubacteria bacterium]
MAATGVESLEGYRRLLARAGFEAIAAEDLSDWWRRILRERLRMYRSLEADTVARFGQAHYDEYDPLGLIQRPFGVSESRRLTEARGSGRGKGHHPGPADLRV